MGLLIRANTSLGQYLKGAISTKRRQTKPILDNDVTSLPTFCGKKNLRALCAFWGNFDFYLNLIIITSKSVSRDVYVSYACVCVSKDAENFRLWEVWGISITQW